MINKPRILFIADKWCSGRIEWGLSAWEGNLWQSLQAVNLAEVEVFHFDEYYRVNGIRGDEAVLEKIAEFQPSAICLVANNFLGTIDMPSLQTLEMIKKRFSIPLFAIWGDPQSESLMSVSDIVGPFIDFNAFTATNAPFRRWKNPKKFSYFWVPKNPKYFYDPGRSRDIDIGFAGGMNPHRLRRIKYLEKHGLKVYCAGGERQGNLPLAEFAEIFQRAKIIIGFSQSGYTQIICARTFEVMNCGAMLLDETNPETAKLFIPYVDYAPYFSNKDMLNKALHYLQNETERVKIANSGKLKTQQYYSAYRFWKIILAKTDEVISGRSDDVIYDRGQPYQLDQADDQLILANWGRKTIDLPWFRLRKLSRVQAVVLKVTDWFCSYELLYFFYLRYQRIKDWRRFMFNCSYGFFKAIRYILPKGLGDSLKEYLKPCAAFMVKWLACEYKGCGLSSWIVNSDKKEKIN